MARSEHLTLRTARLWRWPATIFAATTVCLGSLTLFYAASRHREPVRPRRTQPRSPGLASPRDRAEVGRRRHHPAVARARGDRLGRPGRTDAGVDRQGAAARGRPRGRAGGSPVRRRERSARRARADGRSAIGDAGGYAASGGQAAAPRSDRGAGRLAPCSPAGRRPPRARPPPGSGSPSRADRPAVGTAGTRTGREAGPLRRNDARACGAEPTEDLAGGPPGGVAHRPAPAAAPQCTDRVTDQFELAQRGN